MKRLFILISMVLVSLYMVITSVDHREEILFGNYPSVDVTGMVINQPVASREEVTEKHALSMPLMVRESFQKV